jgi:hypothetical protein
MKSIFRTLLYFLIATGSVVEAKRTPAAKVSFDDFKRLVAEVEPHRAKRMIDFDTFLRMSKEPNTIVLDSRSAFRYDRIHLKGARHLSFTDFTQENLRKTIPPDARILIYCNNNFEGNPVDFADKSYVPTAGVSSMSSEKPGIVLPRDNRGEARQFAAQGKPTRLALNIPTYVNLYGYGYRDIYELSELVDVKDPRVIFEGSLIKK